MFLAKLQVAIGRFTRSQTAAAESRFERVANRCVRTTISFLIWSNLEELDVWSVAKVPRVHKAAAPGEPLVAALHFLSRSGSVMYYNDVDL